MHQIQHLYWGCVYQRLYLFYLFWESEFREDVVWLKVYKYQFNRLLENRVKCFLWKSLNYGLNTKEKVERMKRGDGMCTFCSSEKETIIHLFSECDFIKPIWGNMQSKLRQALNNSDINIVCSRNIILGTGDEYVDLVISYTKWNIWKARNQILFEDMWYTEEALFQQILSRVNFHIKFLNAVSCSKVKLCLL